VVVIALIIIIVAIRITTQLFSCILPLLVASLMAYPSSPTLVLDFGGEFDGEIGVVYSGEERGRVGGG